MAKLIVTKELKQFKEILKEKHVKLTCQKEVIDYMVTKGTSKEFGARAIKRVIENELKPLLVEELLFGRLKTGGACRVVLQQDILTLEIK